MANRPNTGRLLGHLLRSVTFPHWTEHWLRTFLTIVGIALGVANVVAVADLASETLASFRRTVSTLAGSNELEIMSAGGSPLPESVVDQARSVEGVLAAEGLIEAFLPLADHTDQSLYLVGLDFLNSPIWYDQFPSSAVEIDDELVFVSQLDSTMLSDQAVERLGLDPEASLRVSAPAGVRTLRRRGVLRDAPVSDLFSGMVAVMDLPAAQRLLGRESTVDRVAVDVRDDEDPTIVARRLKAVLGNGATVDAPESRGEEVDKLLFSLRSMLLIAGSLAVIVGVFIVFNTVSTSVHQRRRELALLSTVGVRRTALIWLCLIETLALAFLGIAGGLLGARVLAASASGVIGSAASEIWLNLELGTPGRASSTSIAGAGIGLATALLASGLAIRSTFITPTVEALRPPSVEAPSSRSPRTMFALGLTLVMATWAVVFAPSGLGLTATVALVVATQVSAYAGVALIGPPVVAAIGAITRVSARFSASAPIRLAAENLPRTPSRSGATVATIVAAVGMATTLTGLVQSFESAWLNWVEEHFGADLFVGSGSRFHLRAGPPMDIDLAQSIMHIDGVESVEPFRVLNSEVNGQPVFLQGIALDERLAHGGLPMVEGTLGAAAPALRAGTGVLVSDNLATRLGLSMGDVIVIPSPQGPRRLRIEGSYVDYLGSLDLGAIVVAQEQLQDIWRDRYANLFRVWLKPTARADDTRAAILTALGGSGYYVISARQFLDGVQAVLNSFFVATWALVAVAVLVAVIGIVNSELATVIDRRVEITMLRTIGLRSTQLIRAVVLECATLGALGGAIGVLLGLMLSDQFVEVALRLITGWRIPFSLHFGVPIITILAATAVATIAGWIPARAAVRLGVHGGRD